MTVASNKHKIIKFEANAHHTGLSLMAFVCAKCGEKTHRKVDTWFFRKDDNVCASCGHKAELEMQCKKVVGRNHPTVDDMDDPEAFYDEVQRAFDERLKLYEKKGHQWSGWPGAVCIKCGQPDMNEQAVADGWFDFDGSDEDPYPNIVWKSDTHKEYVEHCNGSCPADMSIKEQEEYFTKARELRSKIDKLDEKRVLICGGRDFQDRSAILRACRQHQPTVIIHGAARGADSIASDIAKQFNIKEEAYPAQWNKYGKSAGPIRNQQMLDEGKPDLVLAFPSLSSRGTYDMIERAKKAGIEVVVHDKNNLLPCDPEDACATHGRCWPHSDWTEEKEG